MRARITACQPAEPGTAQLLIRLQDGQAAPSDLTFALCNNEQYYLHPDASWSTAPHWFTLNGGKQTDKGTLFIIDATLVDPLLESTSQVQIQARLASGETRNTTLMMKRDELLPSTARGQTGNFSSSSVLATPAPEPMVEEKIESQPPAPEPVPLASPDVTTPINNKRPSRLPLIAIAVALVLLVTAGALWWFLGRDSAPAAPVTAEKQSEAPAAAPEPTPTAADCSVESLNSQSELEFVQSCVQQNLDSDKLLAIIQSAKEANKCGVAQRLYANRAQGGDNQVALAYAKEYDPKYHQPSECFKEADPDTAVYWYETVLQSAPDDSTAKQRLEELGK